MASYLWSQALQTFDFLLLLVTGHSCDLLQRLLSRIILSGEAAWTKSNDHIARIMLDPWEWHRFLAAIYWTWSVLPSVLKVTNCGGAALGTPVTVVQGGSPKSIWGWKMLKVFAELIAKSAFTRVVSFCHHGLLSAALDRDTWTHCPSCLCCSLHRFASLERGIYMNLHEFTLLYCKWRCNCWLSNHQPVVRGDNSQSGESSQASQLKRGWIKMAMRCREPWGRMGFAQRIICHISFDAYNI